MPLEETTYRDGINSHLKQQDAKLDQILAQTTKTNGRVSSLENWKAYVIGFCACITILIIPVLLLLIKMFFKV